MEINGLHSNNHAAISPGGYSQYPEVSTFRSPHSMDYIRFAESSEAEKGSASGPKKGGNLLNNLLKSICQFFRNLFCCCKTQSSKKPNEDLKAFLAAENPLIFVKEEVERFQRAYQSAPEQVLNKIFEFLSNELDNITDLGDQELLFMSYARALLAQRKNKFSSIYSNEEQSLMRIFKEFLTKKFAEAGETANQKFQAFYTNFNDFFSKILEKLRKNQNKDS